MAKKIGRRTITVIRTVKRDRLSPQPASPSGSLPAAVPVQLGGLAPGEHQIHGCVIMPRLASGAQSEHEELKGWVINEGRMIIAPYGADVLADDHVRIDGVVYSVDGAPGDYENRRGKGRATIFYLDRVGT